MNRSYLRGSARLENAKEKEDNRRLQTVDRALQVLEQFTAARPEWTLTELSRALSLHKTVVFRILGSLEGRGFLVHDPLTKRYRLGTKIIELGGAAMANIDIRRVAQPLLHDLAHQTHESVILGVPRGDEVVCVDKVDSPEGVKLVFHVGERTSLHHGPSGKLILAHLPPAQLDEYLFRTARHGNDALPLSTALKEELEEIRRDGYAYTEGEVVSGGAAVAAPIYDHRGNIAAVLNVAGPKSRLVEKRARLVEQLKTTAHRISTLMGYHGGAGTAGRPTEG